jgi:hypothetical protein
VGELQDLRDLAASPTFGDFRRCAAMTLDLPFARIPPFYCAILPYF